MKQVFIFLLLGCVCGSLRAASNDEVRRVEGSVYAGIASHVNDDQDKLHLAYTTNDPRLGTNSGHRYFSDVDDLSRNLQATYGADLQITLSPQHVLSLSLEGAHDYERATGTRTESLRTSDGLPLASIRGTYDHPHELTHDLSAAVGYTYRLRRPGSSLNLGYRYRWESESAGLEQRIDEAEGWSKYTTNILEQQFRTQTHHAYINYVCPVAKGHLLDFGLDYDRRDLRVRSEQDWDDVRVLDAHYRHLMQYGSVFARYRLSLGRVRAMARLEYRATHMQQRWLHDVLPTASLCYQFDSVHSLTAFYTIALIRPTVALLDTTHIADTYTVSYGNDAILGIHLHNVALTYCAQLPAATVSAEVRYLNTSDGFNAIWMERADTRVFTWGNSGVRHAVSLTPSVDSHLSATTSLHASATVLWDERIAAAIDLINPNWGIRTELSLAQRVVSRPEAKGFAAFVDLRGDYAYHNTLDVYSYAGHGGSVGLDWRMSVCDALKITLGYTALFLPEVHIVQGAYVGRMVYRPGATHIVSLNLSYKF